MSMEKIMDFYLFVRHLLFLPSETIGFTVGENATSLLNAYFYYARCVDIYI